MSTLKPVSILLSLKEVSALPVSWFIKRQDEQTLYMLDLKNSGVESISRQVSYNFITPYANSITVSWWTSTEIAMNLLYVQCK